MNPDNKKREAHLGGEPVGFIIKLENGFTIYHMGDTNVFGDMKLIADYFKPDLILIPIGGHFVMDPKEAALATKMLHPKYAIPIHYGTIPQLKGTPAGISAGARQDQDQGHRHAAGSDAGLLSAGFRRATGRNRA